MYYSSMGKKVFWGLALMFLIPALVCFIIKFWIGMIFCFIWSAYCFFEGLEFKVKRDE